MGLSFLDKHVERPILGGDIDIRKQRVEPLSTVGSEGAIGTLAPSLASTLSLNSLISGIVNVSHELL